MFRFKTGVMVAAAVLAIGACQQQNENAEAAQPAAPAPAAEQPIAAPTPAPAPADLSSPTSEPVLATSPSADVVAADLPEQCRSYLAQVQQCAARLGDNAVTSSMVRQQAESMQRQWASMEDRRMLPQACAMAARSWERRAPAMGC